MCYSKRRKGLKAVFSNRKRILKTIKQDIWTGYSTNIKTLKQMTKIKHYPITKLFKEIAVPQEQHEKNFTTNISCSRYITTLLFSHIFSNPNTLIQSKKIQIHEFSRSLNCYKHTLCHSAKTCT